MRTLTMLTEGAKYQTNVPGEHLFSSWIRLRLGLCIEQPYQMDARGWPYRQGLWWPARRHQNVPVDWES